MLTESEREELTSPTGMLAWTELPRALLEFSTFAAVSPFMSGAPKGDGHDVLFLPGFLWSDRSTRLMRHYLAQLGYRTHGWELGSNFGPSTIGETGQILAERIEAIIRDGSGQLSLVGHSLGGIMARTFALQNPASIRQLICIGSPFVPEPRGVNATVGRLHGWLTGVPPEADASVCAEALEIPSTAIFSHWDGLVSPVVCTENTTEQAQNICVYGSHLGMMTNPAVFYALADRLAQPQDERVPFNPVGWRRAFYPELDKSSFQ